MEGGYDIIKDWDGQSPRTLLKELRQILQD